MRRVMLCALLSVACGHTPTAVQPLPPCQVVAVWRDVYMTDANGTGRRDSIRVEGVVVCPGR